MSGSWTLGAYLASALLALAILWIFRAKAWYWHIMALLIALVVGLVPPPAEWQGPRTDLVVGSVFFFLFIWAVAAPCFRKKKAPAPPTSSETS